MDNLKQKIEEIKAKAIKDIEEAIKEAKKDNVKSKRWRGNDGDIYYTLIYSGDIEEDIEDLNPLDDFRFKTRNYFKTREEAEEHLEKIKIYYELMDIAEELNGDKELDWENVDQKKYSIVYASIKNVFYDTWSTCSKELGVIYCTDSNFLKTAKKRIGEEKLKKIFM